jgi:RNA polymerase sigma-70 factor (ECF subfamily)
VRRRGRSPHDAQDLTQAFFLQLLEHGYLSRADPGKGRFRAFLLVALNHFLTNEWHRSQARKRGGDVATISWDGIAAEENYCAEPYLSRGPERLFEQRWAIAVVDQALRRLQQEFASSGRAHLFEALKGTLTDRQPTEPYAILAERFGLTEPAVKMTVMRLRRRFGEMLREEVAQTVANDAEVDDELRHLLRVLTDSDSAG